MTPGGPNDASRRLLLALPQSPFDLGSGAAVSTRLLAYQLALRGWSVRAVCTSATESGRSGLPPVSSRWDASARVRLPPSEPGGVQRWHIADSGVDFEVWELPEGTRQDWARVAGSAFDRRIDALIGEFVPNVLLAYGAEERDHRIAAVARARGCTVVLALHNLAYQSIALPPHDALLVPSQFLVGRYRNVTRRPIGALPPPMWDPDTRVDSHEGVFFTFFNPERAKGAELVVRLAAALPELPFLIVAGRAGGPEFAAIAQRLGYDPTNLRNVTVSPGGVLVREVLALTRAVLMPSLVEEAAGRVAAEALANGIPAIVSDSGALPETVIPGGQVVPWHRDTGGLATIDEAGLARWVAAVQKLADEDHWRDACAVAEATRVRWNVADQASCADAWFSRIADLAT